MMGYSFLLNWQSRNLHVLFLIGGLRIGESPIIRVDSLIQLCGQIAYAACRPIVGSIYVQAAGSRPDNYCFRLCFASYYCLARAPTPPSGLPNASIAE